MGKLFLRVNTPEDGFNSANWQHSFWLPSNIIEINLSILKILLTLFFKSTFIGSIPLIWLNSI